MGNSRSKKTEVDVTQMERIYPELDYVIKTRPPNLAGGTWKNNIKLKVREEQLMDESMPVARRKCYDPSMEYLACTQREGTFWMVFNCQEEFHYVAQCQAHQFYVQMDKRRRDMTRNTEYWWRQLYDQNGERGRQKDMTFGDLGYWDSMKMTFLGEDSVKEGMYEYGNPDHLKHKQRE